MMLALDTDSAFCGFLFPFHPSEGRKSCMNQTRCAYQDEIDLSPYCSNLDMDLYLPFKGADIPMKAGVMHYEIILSNIIIYIGNPAN